MNSTKKGGIVALFFVFHFLITEITQLEDIIMSIKSK